MKKKETKKTSSKKHSLKNVNHHKLVSKNKKDKRRLAAAVRGVHDDN
jgi:hypothetical protein